MGEVAGGGETSRANPGEAHPGVVAPGYEWYEKAAVGTVAPLFSFRSVQMATGAPKAAATIRPKLEETALSVVGEVATNAELLVLVSPAVVVNGTITATGVLRTKFEVLAPRKLKDGDYTRFIKILPGWTETVKGASEWTEAPGETNSWTEV